jgi:YVTN family beta-propeller protein
MFMSRLLWVLFLIPFALGVLRGTPEGASAPADADGKPRLRRPVALVHTDNGKWLFVANQRAGSISVIDTSTLKATAEVEVGRRLADLVATPDGRYLLAVDEEADELILLSCRGSALEVTHRLSVSPTPVSVRVSNDGLRCFVASLWSRQVTLVDLGPALGGQEKAGTRPRVTKTLALPFAPRLQLPVRDAAKLIVTDSFGGNLAVVDLGRGEVESIRELPAHNIRGLALSADGTELLLAHQTLAAHAQTTRDDIHWGNLVTNTLRGLRLDIVLAPDADVLRGSWTSSLDTIGRGAGDPADLAVPANGKPVISLAGVDEVILHGPAGNRPRLTVVRRPTAVLLSPDGKRAYVANTFADSVSVVDLVQGKVEGAVSLGRQPELSKNDRGELLFHDARLSNESWLSCQSCHTDGHTNGRLNDNLGDGSFGAPKRVLSLLGVKETGPWAWNGGMASLGDQVRKSIQTTMHGPKPSDEQVQELTAYLETLAPPPALARLRGQADEPRVKHGQEVFTKQGCANCHVAPTYTSGKTYDVGLPDEAGQRYFNPPSLRGVSQGSPFFHDGRAATLEEVFSRYQHQLKDKLTPQELADLLGFLRSL